MSKFVADQVAPGFVWGQEIPAGYGFPKQRSVHTFHAVLQAYRGALPVGEGGRAKGA